MFAEHQRLTGTRPVRGKKSPSDFPFFFLFLSFLVSLFSSPFILLLLLLFFLLLLLILNVLENGSCLWGEGGGDGREKRLLGWVAWGGLSGRGQAPVPSADCEVAGPTRQRKAPPSDRQPVFFGLPFQLGSERCGQLLCSPGPTGPPTPGRGPSGAAKGSGPWGD